ncbi:MAG: bifunctional UDP-N-acetylglucosamine diphosphorylase/glucosamine-1-phosphate N-acetyltransferase GlmU [Legionellaceae bacterium]|nr:bifunctional UDP-N-acetylglucosamine diphosphorylase/glucosamine-1-phosphate N-acetyltransferase GlmU [Legionellaceae bacterium]
MELHIVVLAAGMGQRMKSNTPKIMHEVGGTPMFSHVASTALSLGPTQIHAIVNQDSQQIRDRFANLPINWVEQQEQLGTGHAVLQALPYIPKDAYVLVLYADTPLLQSTTIQPLIDQAIQMNSLSLLVANIDNPFGLGRIVRDTNGQICAIVEEKDATTEIRNIHEIYTGICCAKARDMHELIPAIDNRNAQHEYYLTDIIALALKAKIPISSITASNNDEIQGVNNRMQLQKAERAYQLRLANELLIGGVSIADACRIDIRGKIKCMSDVYIDVNCVFTGDVSIGCNTIIEQNCKLTNVVIGDNCKILANSVLEDCTIDDNCEIGPFARLRPGTELASGCKIGNFVEIKNTKMAQDSKASHLSYLGDSVIGKKVNIGAGTITCNYDGVNKHQTTIEDGVFVGSDTQLIAPVTIGENATIGAGSTIRKNVPPNELSMTVSTQKVIYGWKRPVKK